FLSPARIVPICTNVQTKWSCQQKSLLRSRSKISHWTAFEGRNVLQIDILKGHSCNTDANALARPPYPDDCRPGTAQPLSGWLRHDQRKADGNECRRLHPAMGRRPSAGCPAAA